MTVETIHLPHRIERRIADLYFQLFAAILEQQDHAVSLKDIEPDELGGWHMRFTCDVATEAFLRSVSGRGCDQSNPLWMIA